MRALIALTLLLAALSQLAAADQIGRCILELERVFENGMEESVQEIVAKMRKIYPSRADLDVPELSNEAKELMRTSHARACVHLIEQVEELLDKNGCYAVIGDEWWNLVQAATEVSDVLEELFYAGLVCIHILEVF